jgi:hypothetical protein
MAAEKAAPEAGNPSSKKHVRALKRASSESMLPVSPRRAAELFQSTRAVCSAVLQKRYAAFFSDGQVARLYSWQRAQQMVLGRKKIVMEACTQPPRIAGPRLGSQAVPTCAHANPRARAKHKDCFGILGLSA